MEELWKIYLKDEYLKADTWEEIENTTNIILNTKGTMNDVSLEMKRLLDFIDGKEPEDEYTRDLAEAVKSVRNNEKWNEKHCTHF